MSKFVLFCVGLVLLLATISYTINYILAVLIGFIVLILWLKPKAKSWNS